MLHLRSLTCLLILGLLSIGSSPICQTAIAQTTDSPAPNIIFILCDDLGWGDLGVLHQNDSQHDKTFQTPHLDALAADGAQLRNHYCPAPVCAPSRASLLLGQHQGHSEIRDNQFDKALPDNHTLASVMKAAGYHTAIVGKYGLQGRLDKKYRGENSPVASAGWPAYPTRRGFDDFFGYVRHVDGHAHYPADNWPIGNSPNHRGTRQVWHNDQEISEQLQKCYTTDLFTAFAKKWIVEKRRNSEKPFFMYLAYDTPHAALQIPTCAYPAGGGVDGGLQWTGMPGHMINTAIGTIDSYRHPDVTGRGWSDTEERFATMVRRIDHGVGDLRQTLRDLGIDGNTLIVFSSDNGPHDVSYIQGASYDPTSFQSYGPFDGTKRDAWEGGVRVPTLAAWPARIPAGTIDITPGQFHDWMATFADAAGTAIPAVCDGVSLLPPLTQSGKRDGGTVYVEYNHRGRTKNYDDFAKAKRGRKRGQMQVVHVDGYKGVRVDIKSQNDPFEIYDLENDPDELKNLAGTSPAMRQLQETMHAFVARHRRPNSSAHRPYDDAVMQAVEVTGKIQPGALLAHQKFPGEHVVKLGPNPQTSTIDSAQQSPRSVPVGSVVRLSGYLKVPEPGVYRIDVRCQTPWVLRLHEATVLDRDRGDEIDPATVRLSAGLHPYRLHMRGADGQAQWQFRWSDAKTGPLEPIPADALVTTPR